MDKIVYANSVAYEVPRSITDLQGPRSGVVTLPNEIYWGPKKVVDLANPVDVQRMYQALVRIGSGSEQINWLNAEILALAWGTLVLPIRCRSAWETKFPELLEV